MMCLGSGLFEFVDFCETNIGAQCKIAAQEVNIAKLEFLSLNC